MKGGGGEDGGEGDGGEGVGGKGGEGGSDEGGGGEGGGEAGDGGFEGTCECIEARNCQCVSKGGAGPRGVGSNLWFSRM